MGKKKISSVDQMVASALERKTTKKIPSTKWIIIIVAILIAIPLFIFVRQYMILNLLPTPQRTVNRYFNHIAREEYDQAYALLKDPFKASKGESIDNFIGLFELSRQNGTIYKKADILGVKDTNRKSVKMVSFQLNLREKGRPTKANGAYYLEKDPDNNIWYIIDSAS